MGLAIWLGVGQAHAPFPRESGLFDHSHDYCYGVPLAIVGVEIPEDVLPHLAAFRGERLVRHPISTLPHREATAWLTDTVMGGAESVLPDEKSRQGYRPLGDQYHPVTMHWQTPDGRVGWMRMRHEGPVDARVEPGRLTIQGYVDPLFAERGTPAHYEYTFELHLPGGLYIDSISPEQWRLPGLTIDVETELQPPEVLQQEDRCFITYHVSPDWDVAGFTFQISTDR